MNQFLHDVYFNYFRRGLFYSGQFASEYGKVFRFNNEILLILAVWKIKPVWWELVIAMLTALFFSALLGKILVLLHIVKYDASLGNQQNPEMMEILQYIRDQKKK